MAKTNSWQMSPFIIPVSLSSKPSLFTSPPLLITSPPDNVIKEYIVDAGTEAAYIVTRIISSKPEVPLWTMCLAYRPTKCTIIDIEDRRSDHVALYISRLQYIVLYVVSFYVVINLIMCIVIIIVPLRRRLYTFILYISKFVYHLDYTIKVLSFLGFFSLRTL